MKLANEKSLELNLTHQLLSSYTDAYSVGYTQQEEGRTGIDSRIHSQDRIILFQYKAAHNGIDGQNATFQVNNNTYRDQHVKLKGITQVLGRGCVYYVFPLVVEDNFFRANAGSLLLHSIFVDVDQMPTYNIGDAHKIDVRADGSFTAHSEPNDGKGIKGEEFIKRIINKDIGYFGKEREEKFEVLLEQALRKQYIENLKTEKELHGGVFKITSFNPHSPKITIYRWKPTDISRRYREDEE